MRAERMLHMCSRCCRIAPTRRCRRLRSPARLALSLAALLSLVRGSGSAELALSANAIRGGSTFDVTITAPEWDTSPDLVGSLRSVVTCDKANEPVHDLNLIETNEASGIFVGRMVTVLSAAAALPLPGLINVVPGTLMKVAHPSSALAATIRVLYPGDIVLPPSIAIGEELLLHLQDPDLNLDSAVKDTTSVIVSVACTKENPSLECPAEQQERLPQQAEHLTLVETTPDSGIFTAAINTYLQQGSNAPHAGAGDQAIDLRGASTMCGADEVTVTYLDSAPGATRTAMARASFRGDILLSQSQIRAGANETINITVTDGDLLNRSSVVITISSSKADEPPETITLASTGTCQGTPTFRGTFYTQALRPQPVDGDVTVQVRPGDMLTISYRDEAPNVLTRKHIRVLTDGALAVGPARPDKSLLLGDTSIATVQWGGLLTMTVTDEDQDSDPFVANTVEGVVVVVADNSSRSLVALTETGLSTAVFTGTHLVREASSGAGGSSWLAASPGSLINVSYSDFDSRGSLQTRLGSARVASNGTISIQTGSNMPQPGDTLSITVVDSDLDQLNTSETVSVFVRADDTQDSKVVLLTELAASSSVFTGAIGTSTSPDASKLMVSASAASVGSVVEAGYSDAMPIATVIARLRMCSHADLTISPDFFIPGSSSLSITLVDADLQADPLGMDRVTISVVATSETDSLELVETGWATSTFTGVLATSTAMTAVQDGVIRVRECCSNRDTVLVEYAESCPSRQLSSSSSKSAVPGSVTASPTLVKPGQTITVTVVDATLNQDSGSPESFGDLVAVSANNQTMNVAVTETGSDSGVFVGTLVTAAAPEAGKLFLPDIAGVNSSPIIVKFTDVVSSLEPQAVVLETQRKGSVTMTQQGVDAGRLSIGQSVVVAAYDKDLDYSGASVSVALSKTGLPDAVTISLVEDGLGEGRYTGVFETTAANGPLTDKVLNNIIVGETITATYTDTDGSQSSATLIAGTTGSLVISNVDSGLVNEFTEFIDVTLIDSDLNIDSTQQETYIYQGATGVVNFQRETLLYAVEMVEQSVNSANFVARINFKLGANAAMALCTGVIDSSCAISRLVPTGPNDVSLRWDRARLEYTDPDIPNGGKVQGLYDNRVKVYIAPGQDAALRLPIPQVVVAGAIFQITVVDQDMSKNLYEAETLSVQVTNNGPTRANELVQTVTLTETGIQSAEFTGELRTYNDLSINSAVAGGMNVAEGESLTISYLDANRRASSIPPTAPIFKDLSVIGWNTCRGGTLDGQMCAGISDVISCGTGYCGSSKPFASVDQFKVGSCVAITLRDPDSNTDDASPQSLVIQAVNLLRNDEETITLREASMDSQNFVGCIPSVAVGPDEVGTKMDGQLAVFAGDEISVRFEDTVPVVSISRTLVAVASHEARLAVEPLAFKVGEALRIEVEDADVVGQTLPVMVAVMSAGAWRDSIAINLTATTAASATFTALLSTSAIERSLFAGLNAGDQVKISYEDELPKQTTRSISAVVGYVGQVKMSQVRLQGTASVTLTDLDARDTMQIEASVRVVAESGEIVDSKPVILHRTSIETVFIGHYAITSANTAPDAHSNHPILLHADLSTSIAVVYVDDSPAYNVSEVVRVVSSTAAEVYTPQSIPSGTPVFITIVDQDLNLDSAKVDSTETTISSSDRDQQDEVVGLLETSPSSGTFTGLIATYQGVAHAPRNDGALDANPGDILTVTYRENAPDQIVVVNIPVTASSQGLLSLSSYSIKLGQLVTITVEDSDINEAPANVDMSAVDVSDGVVSRIVALKETDVASSRFTGTFETASMELVVGNELTVTYHDEAPRNEALSRATLVASHSATIDIGPSAAEFLYDARLGLMIRTLAAGDSVVVTVKDADLNDNIQTIQESEVTFYTSRNDQLAKVRIYETGVNSDTFTGRLATRLVELPVSGAVDMMDVVFGDSISAFYNDQAPVATIKSTVLARIATPGTITLLPTSVVAGSDLEIILYDQDLDRNATLQEVVDVTIVSSRIIGSSYVIQLTETADGSGVFTASIKTRDKVTAALAHHGVVDVQVNDQVSVEYEDASPSQRVIRATSHIISASCGCATIDTNLSNMAAGQSLVASVYDPDQDKRSDISDSLTVLVMNLGRPNQAFTQLALHESGVDTGIFTGVLQTVDSKIQPDVLVGISAEINVNSGDNLELVYTSITPDGTLDKTVLVYVQDVAEMRVTPKPLLAGDPADITVRDDDMDLGPEIDTTLARVSSSRAKEPVKEVTLVETGARSGTFTGRIEARRDSKAASISDIGVIHVDAGDILTFSYEESVPHGRLVQVRAPIAQVATISISPVPLRENGYLAVEIVDIDADLDGYRIESVSINVSSHQTTGQQGIQRTLDLLETGKSTGVFTASMRMSSNEADSHLQLAPVRARETLAISYLDRAPASMIEQEMMVLESAVAYLSSAATLKAGQRLALTVTDPDLNGRTPETIEVMAEAYSPVLALGVPPGTYSREGNCTVTLRKRTPYETSFYGFLATRVSADAPSIGCLQVAPDDKVKISYSDLSPIADISNEVFVVSSAQGIIGASRDKLMTQGSVHVTVVDRDMNLKDDKVETLQIQVHTSVSGLSAVELILTETSLSSPSFTASIQVEPWTSCTLDGWGCSHDYRQQLVTGTPILYVMPGQTVVFEYLDLAPYASRQSIVPVCTTAKLEVHPLVIAIGWNVTIYVDDLDRAGDGAIQVTATVQDDGSPLELSLLEYAPGKFSGIAQTSFVSEERNSTIQLVEDGTIHIVFSDDCPGKSTLATIKAYVLGTIRLNPNPIQVGEEMTIEVVDAQHAKKTGSSTVKVICTGSHGDEQVVVLAQEATDPSRYSGQQVPGLAGQISGEVDMPLSCRYPLQTPPSLLVQTAQVRRSFTGVLTATPDIVNTGGVLTISVNDKDLNTDPTRIETHSMRIVAQTPQDSKRVDLTEVSVDSLIFTGMVIVAKEVQTGASLDTLVALDQVSVSVTYSDNAPKGTAQIQVAVAASNVGDLRIKPDIIRVGSELQVLVADADLNRDPKAIESSLVSVSVLSPGSRDGIVDVQGVRHQMRAVVHMTEMMANTQFFTGKLITVGISDAKSKPDTPEFENVIYVQAGYEVTLEYNDAAPLSVVKLQTVALSSQIGTMSFSPNPPTIGEALTVTVVDPDLVYDAGRDILPGVDYSAGPSNCDVFGSNQECRDVGVLPIVPTTPDGSVFTGVLHLFDGIATGSAGPCYLTCHDVSTREGASLVFFYADAAPKQTYEGSIKVATRAHLAVKAIGLQGVIDITVYDQDLNQNSTLTETGQVEVRRDPSFTIHSVLVNLTETGDDTGYFTGLLETTTSASPPVGARGQVLTSVLVGQNISVKYYDDSPTQRWIAHSSLVQPSNLARITFNATGEQIGNIFMKPARVTFYLHDNDLNLDQFREDTAHMKITSSDVSQGAESLTMLENGFDTGVFTADVRFTLGSFNAIPDNLAFDVREADLITAEYEDRFPFQTIVKVAKVASIGTLIVNPAPVTAGRDINITVVDSDLNSDSAVINEASIIIFNKEYTDNETVVLKEISTDSSVFTGVTASTTEKGSIRNTLSGLYEGGAVHAIYADAIPEYVSNDCKQCLVTSRVAMTANVSISPSLLQIAGSLTVTVVDTDLNRDDARTESGEVQVKQFFREPYDMRRLIVTETGPNTDVFTGEIATSPNYIPGKYGSYDEGLYGPQGGRITADYLDKDPLPSVVRSAFTRLSMIGRITAGPNPVNPDGRITITLNDDDLDMTMDIDQQSTGAVFISSPNDYWNQGGVSVLLQETGQSTGFFVGTRETQEQQSTAASVIVSGAVQGSYVTVTYQDSIPSGTRQTRVRVATFANLTVTPLTVFEGNTISVTVADTDLDDDPNVAEQHTVRVLQESADPDTVNMTLVETSNSSKFFTGTLKSSLNGGVGILKAPEGSLVKVQYVDQNPTPARTLTVNRRVSIQGQLYVNTATEAAQGTMPDGQARLKPTMLDTGGNAMTSCFAVSGQTACSSSCLCRSFPKILATVIDEDVEAPEVPLVVAYNTKGVEYETITMVSTGVEATFTGELTVSDSSVEGASDSGQLNLVSGDIIQVAYIDASPPRNVLINYRIPSFAKVEFVPKVGSTWTIDNAVIVGLDFLNLKLTDFDLTGQATATVTISGNVGNDAETIVMRATEVPWIFTGSIVTESNYRGVNPNDGKMQVHREDTLTASYSDAFPASTQGMQLGVNYLVFRAELFTHQKVILPDGALHITLVDCDLPQLAIPSTEAFVQVSNAAGDSLTVTLTETSTVCGEYTGMAQTATRQTFDPLKMDSAVPGSQVTVKYLDCNDNTPRILMYNIAKQGNLTLARSVASTAAGLPVTVYLEDIDQDSTSEADRANVTITKQGSETDTEVVMVTETGAHSGVFTAALNTSFDDTQEMLNQSNGILHRCSKGDRVTASYIHATLGTRTTSSMSFLSEAGVVTISNGTQPFAPNETLTITVRDADLNQDVDEAETYGNIVGVDAGNDREWVPIRETARNSRVFTGVVATLSAPGSTFDGVLNTDFKASGGSIARFVYNDTVLASMYPLLCQTAGIPHGCHMQYRRALNVGELLLSQSVHAVIGQTLDVTVMDGDLNQDFTQTESVTVQIVKDSGDAQIEVSLIESGDNTGVFTGSLTTSDTGTSSGNHIVLTKFDSVTFSYQDMLPIGLRSVVIEPRYLGTLLNTFNVILPGGAARISLTDKDLNTNDAVAETVSGILVTNIMTHQREQVTLTETGVSASSRGTFTGILSTLADKSRGIDFSGSMKVQAGDLLSVTYADAGPVEAVSRDVRVATKGDISKSPLQVAVGVPMTVTVSDLDMDRDVSAADTIPDLLSVSKDSLNKVIPLTETGLSTGIFTGEVTPSGSTMRADTFGPVAAWESITVTYTDQMPQDKIEKILPVFALGEVTVSPWPWVNVAAEALTVTVSDIDMNRDPMTAETLQAESDQTMVTLYARSPKLQVIDRELISLTENDLDSGVFTGTIDVSGTGSVVLNDGIVAPTSMQGGSGVSSGYIIEASYLDVAPSKRVKADAYPSNTGVIGLTPCLPGESPCMAVVGAGVTLTVQVTDRDLNLDSSSEEQITVTLRTDRQREPVEILTLSECRLVANGTCVPHPDSNVFVGEIQTVRSASYSQPNDGKLNVIAGDCDKACTGCDVGSCNGFIVAEYADASPAAVIKKYAKVGHIGRIDLCGQIENQPPLDYCLFDFSKNEITVTVTDPDLNRVDHTEETYADAPNTPTGMRVTVHAQFSHSVDHSLVTSTSLNVAIKETGINSNVFTGLFAPLAGQASAGSLQIFNDNTQNILRSASAVVTATYQDATSEFPKAYARFRTDAKIVMAGPDCQHDDAGGCTLAVGDAITITVTDGDMDQDRNVAEMVTVKIKSESTTGRSGLRDEQDMVLMETGASTGIFAASVTTVAAKSGLSTTLATCDNTVLHAYEEENVKFTARYNELAPLAPKNLQATVGLAATWPGKVTISPNVTHIGAEVTVTVQDFDLFGTGSNVLVEMTSDYTATQILLEVTNQADTFTGTYNVAASNLGNPSGTQRRLLTAKYTDASHGNIIRTFSAQLASRGVLTTSPFLDTISNLAITLEDSSLDQIDEVETLTQGVVVSTEVGGSTNADDYRDIETVILVETGPSTSTFTGTLPIVRAAIKNVGDGILQGDLGATSQATGLTVPQISITYQDSLPPQSVVLIKNIECEGRVIVPRTFVPKQTFTVTVSDCDLAASNAPNAQPYLDIIPIILKTDRGEVVSNITLSPKLPFDSTKYEAMYTGTVSTNSSTSPYDNLHELVSSQEVGSIVSVIYVDDAPRGPRQSNTVASILAQLSVNASYNNRISYNSKYKIDKKSLMTIKDRDANIDSTKVDSVTIMVKTAFDEERIDLVETGLDRNTFTGWLSADSIGADVVGDGLISPVTSHMPIIIRYLDPDPGENVTMIVTGSDFDSLEMSSLVNPVVGAPIRVTVVDSDLNTDANAAETSTGALTLSKCSPRRNKNCINASDDALGTGSYCEQQSVPLQESAQSSAIFKGELAALTCLNEREDRDSKFYVICEGLETCQVTATYSDDTWGDFTTSASASRMGLLDLSYDTSFAGPGFMVAGEALSVTISDADLDGNISRVDSITVSVNTSADPPHTLILTETGNSTGVFTAIVATIATGTETKQYRGIETPQARLPLAVETRSVATPVLGRILVTQGTDLIVEYHDSSPIGHDVSASVRVQGRAQVACSPRPMVPSNASIGVAAIHVTVTDLHASNNLTVNVSITAGSEPAQPDRALLLTETAPASGVFIGSLRTVDILTGGMFYTSQSIVKYKVTYFQTGTGGSTRPPMVFSKQARDAALQVTSHLRAGAALHITVMDDDQDLDWDSVDTVVVQVTSDKVHESSEEVTLFETGSSSGMFTGLLVTSISHVASGKDDGLMHVVQGNLLRVAYVEPFDRYGEPGLLQEQVNLTDGGSPGEILFVDPDQAYAKAMLINEGASFVHIMVVDKDASSTVYSSQITVTTPLQSLSFPLNENTTSDLGQNRYLLTLPVSKQMGTASILGGISMGNVVTLSYDDMLPHVTVTTQGLVNKAAVLTAQPQPIGMGSTLTITVTDEDLNEDINAPDVGSVMVQSSRDKEGTEVVTITETDKTSNVFTGLLRTALRTLAGAANSGNVNVELADQLMLTYIERVRNSNVVDASKLKSLTIHVGLPGTLQTSEVVRPSEYLVISVVDPDLNLSPENMLEAKVTVTTSKDGESELVMLTQTSPTSGIFTGVLLTCTRCLKSQCPDLCISPPCTCIEQSSCQGVTGPLPMNCPSELEGPSNDGVLYVEQGNLISVKYKEPMPEMTHSAFSHVARLGSVTTIPEAYLLPGNDVTVIILDNDANADPTAIESVEVDFLTQKLDESSERLIVYEDDVDSGRFVGSLKTLASTPANPINSGFKDSTLAVDPGDIIIVSYQDLKTFEGTQQYITKRLITSAAGTLDACAVNSSKECLHWSYVDEGVTVFMALPGERLSINVSDIDLAIESDTLNVTAYVNPTATADYEELQLSLMGNSIFSGTLESEVGDVGIPGDGILTVTSDCEITFTYLDEVPRETKKAIIRMAGRGVLSIGPRLFNGYPALAVNLTDRDLNTKEALREVVTVEIVNARFPDSIARVGLIESAPSSGFFQGSITLTYASTPESVNDGTLRGLSGDQVTVRYHDMLPVHLIHTTAPLRFAGGLLVSDYEVAGNELFQITLTDGDLDFDKTRPDRVDGILSAVSDVESVIVSMTETAVDNGIFTASILPRLTGTSIEIDAIDPFGLAFQIQVNKGTNVAMTYVDGDNGIPTTQRVTIFTRAQVGISVTFSGSGDGALQVTMTDADLIGSSVPLKAQVYTSDAEQAVETITLSAESAGSPRFTGNVLAQAHTGVQKPGVISLRDTDTIFAQYYDLQPITHVVTEKTSPMPRFIEPTPLDGAEFETAVDCAFQIGLRGADRSLASRRLVGAAVLIKATRYRENNGTFQSGQVPGVSLSPAEPGISFETSMSWTPRREQEGLVYMMCFAVAESHGLVSTGGDSERCFQLTVSRCRKCASPGENLNQMAVALGSEWLTMWSFNPEIKTPHELLDGSPVNTSLLYKVAPGDSLASISMRFGTTVRYLLAMNSHLTASGDLEEDQVICVLPNQIAIDGCPAQKRSTTWEKLSEQYVPVDYYDNPFNWEDIQWTDLIGKPVKMKNVDYPQLPARVVGEEAGYSHLVE